MNVDTCSLFHVQRWGISLFWETIWHVAVHTLISLRLPEPMPDSDHLRSYLVCVRRGAVRIHSTHGLFSGRPSVFLPFCVVFRFERNGLRVPLFVCGVGVVIIFTVSYIGFIFRGGGLSFWSVVIFFYVFLFVVISEKKWTVWIWLRLLLVTLLAVFSFLGVCLSKCHFTGEKKFRSGHKIFFFL